MKNIEFAKNLEKRTKKFAVKIIQLLAALPKTPESMTIRNQFTKSGTSIGANYREANRAEAGKTFLIRLKFAKVRQVKYNTGWK